MQQDGKHVDHELLQHLAMADAEGGEGIVGDGGAAGEPAESVIGFAVALDLSSGADALGEGVEPEGEHHPGAQGGPAGLALDGLGVAGEAREVEGAEDQEEGAGDVIRRHHPIRILAADGALGVVVLERANLGVGRRCHALPTTNALTWFAWCIDLSKDPECSACSQLDRSPPLGIGLVAELTHFLKVPSAGDLAQRSVAEFQGRHAMPQRLVGRLVWDLAQGLASSLGLLGPAANSGFPRSA